MTAVNQRVIYKPLRGRTTPKYVDLPVQAGATQAIKVGELCIRRSVDDFSTYPIIPASAGSDDGQLYIAEQEQAAGDAARLLRFIEVNDDFAFEFALDGATTCKPGETVSISDSQTLVKNATNPVGIIEQDDLLNASGDGKSVSKVFVRFTDRKPALGSGGILKQESAILDHADFTDGESTAGSIDTGIDLPAGALVLGYALVVSEAFTGDTSGTAELGDGTDPDRFNGLPDNPSVYATGTVQSNFPAAGAYCASAVDVKLTITGAADWGNVTAGKVKVQVFYTMAA